MSCVNKAVLRKVWEFIWMPPQ